MSVLREMFTWWNGQTLGTRLFTARRGKLVGKDEAGNHYYQTRDGKRRWVVYNGEADASRVPSDWHGWLHHTFAQPPTRAPLPKKSWEKPHLPNMTGTPDAYRPAGSIARDGQAPGARRKAGGDYESWSPE